MKESVRNNPFPGHSSPHGIWSFNLRYSLAQHTVRYTHFFQDGHSQRVYQLCASAISKAHYRWCFQWQGYLPSSFMCPTTEGSRFLQSFLLGVAGRWQSVGRREVGEEAARNHFNHEPAKPTRLTPSRQIRKVW